MAESSTYIPNDTHWGFKFPEYDPYLDDWNGVNLVPSERKKYTTPLKDADGNVLKDPISGETRHLTAYCYWKPVQSIISMNISPTSEESSYTITRANKVASSVQQSTAFSAEIGASFSVSAGVPDIAEITTQISVSFGVTQEHTSESISSTTVVNTDNVGLQENSVLQVWIPCITFETETFVRWTLELKNYVFMNREIDFGNNPKVRVVDDLSIDFPTITKSQNSEGSYIDMSQKPQFTSALSAFQNTAKARQQVVFRYWSFTENNMFWSFDPVDRGTRRFSNIYMKDWATIQKYPSCKEIIQYNADRFSNAYKSDWAICQDDPSNPNITTDPNEVSVKTRSLIPIYYDYPTNETDEGLYIQIDQDNWDAFFNAWKINLAYEWSIVAGGGIPPSIASREDSQIVEEACKVIEKNMLREAQWFEIPSFPWETMLGGVSHTKKTVEFSSASIVAESDTQKFTESLGISVSASGSFEFGSVGASLESTFTSSQSVTTSTSEENVLDESFSFYIDKRDETYQFGVVGLRLSNTFDPNGDDPASFSYQADLIFQWDNINADE